MNENKSHTLFRIGHYFASFDCDLANSVVAQAKINKWTCPRSFQLRMAFMKLRKLSDLNYTHDEVTMQKLLSKILFLAKECENEDNHEEWAEMKCEVYTQVGISELFRVFDFDFSQRTNEQFSFQVKDKQNYNNYEKIVSDLFDDLMEDISNTFMDDAKPFHKVARDTLSLLTDGLLAPVKGDIDTFVVSNRKINQLLSSDKCNFQFFSTGFRAFCQKVEAEVLPRAGKIRIDFVPYPQNQYLEDIPYSNGELPEYQQI